MLTIINYEDLIQDNKTSILALINALYSQGIVGVRDVPSFAQLSNSYIQAARAFCQLPEEVKSQYAPDRTAGLTEGYELGAEKFKNEQGQWQIDNKKASYYAFVPDHERNLWPREVNFKKPYLALGQLIFETGKLVLKKIGLPIENVLGYGRLLHYQVNNDHDPSNSKWCGTHYDHGIFTGLMPAYYFENGEEIEEPSDAGLFIRPTNNEEYVKIDAMDKNILLFQVGEFGQLLSNDRICATKHFVKKASGQIERFSFALFYSFQDDVVIQSNSMLINDTRYKINQSADGSLTYGQWQAASLERYHAK